MNHFPPPNTHRHKNPSSVATSPVSPLCSCPPCRVLWQSGGRPVGGWFLILKPGYYSMRGQKGPAPASQPPARRKCQLRKSQEMLPVGETATKYEMEQLYHEQP